MRSVPQVWHMSFVRQAWLRVGGLRVHSKEEEEEEEDEDIVVSGGKSND